MHAEDVNDLLCACRCRLHYARALLFQLVSGTHLVEQPQRPQVWRDQAVDGEMNDEGKRNKEDTGVGYGHQANCIQVEDQEKAVSPDR